MVIKSVHVGNSDKKHSEQCLAIRNTFLITNRANQANLILLFSQTKWIESIDYQLNVEEKLKSTIMRL